MSNGLSGYPERAISTEHRGRADGGDQHQLPPCHRGTPGDQEIENILCSFAALHQIEGQPSEARIGDILAERRAYPRPHIRTAAGDGNARRGQRYSDHAGQRAASRDGHRHVRRSSGMTAVTSISTSHSGRASADTTTPVETG